MDFRSVPSTAQAEFSRRRLIPGLHRLYRVIDRGGALLVLVFMVIVLSVFNPTFGRLNNLLLIGLEAATISLVAIGMTIVILSGGIDLSVGSLVGFTGVVSAGLMKWGAGPLPPLPSYLAILVGWVVGGLAGALHGLIITRFKIPPFIITLGTLSIFKGLALVYSNASPIHQLPDDFKWIVDGSIGGVSVAVIFMLGAYLMTWYILDTTTFGRYVYAIGGNESAARLAGIAVDRCKIAIYALSGLMSAIAGTMLLARLDGGIYTNGEGYELTAIAGVVIGGSSLMGGTGSIWGTIAGVCIITTVNNALVLYSVPPEWKHVVTGSMIVCAVLLDLARKYARMTR